jgi:predicted DNA-binding transcriptional regulator YafY
MGGGRTPGGPTILHPYAGDERLAQVLAGLRAGQRPSAAILAGEWGVSRRTAERIIAVARSLHQD